MDILPAKDMIAQNVELTKEYREELYKNLVHDIEEMTKVGEKFWQFNIIKYIKDGTYDKERDGVVFDAIIAELEKLGYHAKIDGARLFMWGLNEIQ